MKASCAVHIDGGYKTFLVLGQSQIPINVSFQFILLNCCFEFQVDLSLQNTILQDKI